MEDGEVDNFTLGVYKDDLITIIKVISMYLVSLCARHSAKHFT